MARAALIASALAVRSCPVADSDGNEHAKRAVSCGFGHPGVVVSLRVGGPAESRSRRAQSGPLDRGSTPSLQLMEISRKNLLEDCETSPGRSASADDIPQYPVQNWIFSCSRLRRAAASTGAGKEAGFGRHEPGGWRQSSDRCSGGGRRQRQGRQGHRPGSRKAACSPLPCNAITGPAPNRSTAFRAVGDRQAVQGGCAGIS